MSDLTLLLIMLSPLLAAPVIIIAIVILDWAHDLWLCIDELITASKARKTARIIKQAEFSLWHYSRSNQNLRTYKNVRFHKAVNA